MKVIGKQSSWLVWEEIGPYSGEGGRQVAEQTHKVITLTHNGMDIE